MAVRIRLNRLLFYEMIQGCRAHGGRQGLKVGVVRTVLWISVVSAVERIFHLLKAVAPSECDLAKLITLVIQVCDFRMLASSAPL